MQANVGIELVPPARFVPLSSLLPEAPSNEETPQGNQGEQSAGPITLPSLYTSPYFETIVSYTDPTTGVKHLIEVTTEEMMNHPSDCAGGENCDDSWREQNTRELEAIVEPHRRYHAYRERTGEFPIIAEIAKSVTGPHWWVELATLLKRERDWVNGHGGAATPYPYTLPMFDV